MVLPVRWIAGSFDSTWIWIEIYIPSAFHFSNKLKISYVGYSLFQTAYDYEDDVNQFHRSEKLCKLKNSSTEAKNSVN
jgi:hypothetical protein